MIPDPISGLAAFLKADAAVAALVGTRVFGLELPRTETDFMPRQAVVLNAAGGGSVGPGANDRVEIQRVRVDVFCYGETPFEAAALRLTVHEAVKQMTTNIKNNMVLHDAVLSGGPIALRDRETNWPISMESWIVTASELAAT